MSENSSEGGISLVGLLGVAFIVLKLCGIIEWKWVWVLSPFWISAAISIIALIIIAILRHHF